MSKGKSNGFFKVVKNESTLFNSSDDRGKIVIHQDYVSCIFCNFRTLDSHSYPDIGLLECLCIINTIPGCCYDDSLALHSFYYIQFVIRSNTCEYNALFLVQLFPVVLI
jgi:hypothetical protein